MAAIKDLVQIVKEFRENMDNVNDEAFGPSNPNAKNNPYVCLDKGKAHPATEEHRVLQGSYELLHSHGLMPTEELAKYTLRTIRSYLEDLSESLTKDFTDVHPSLRDVYETEDPKLILGRLPEIKEAFGSLGKNNGLAIERIRRLARSLESGFRFYSTNKNSQKRSLRVIVEHWRESQLFYHIGLNLDEMEKYRESEGLSKYSEGSPLHRRMFNEGVDKIVKIIYKL